MGYPQVSGGGEIAFDSGPDGDQASACVQLNNRLRMPRARGEWVNIGIGLS